MSLITIVRLWWAQIKRNGLRREHARLHQMRAGVDWELARNGRDALAQEDVIAALEESHRRKQFARKFAVRAEP